MRKSKNKIQRQKRIYLDHAATTPVKKEVLKAIQPYFSEKFGNPSSVHFFGQEAKRAIDKSRQIIADFLNVKPTEIIFTSGGTEANNLAIKGIVFASRKKFSLPHVITSSVEHHCILHTCEYLERQKLAEVTYLPVDKFGMVNPLDLEKTIRSNTVFVSVMYANNEIGTIQPIKELVKITKRKNPSIIFHTDAVQAIGDLNCKINYLGVDMLSISGHKIGAPKGIGMLYIRSNIEIHPLLHGGPQEFRKRAGTENVVGIIGLGKAIELLRKKEKKNEKIKKLRDKLIKGILEKIPETILTGHPLKRLVNNASFCFKGVDGEAVLLNLDLEGIAASSGSACASLSLKPSHVLSACGIDPLIAKGAIRFTLGEENTEREIDKVLKVLPLIIKKLRKISGY